jgi:hypothetical protein
MPTEMALLGLEQDIVHLVSFDCRLAAFGNCPTIVQRLAPCGRCGWSLRNFSEENLVRAARARVEDAGTGRGVLS